MIASTLALDVRSEHSRRLSSLPSRSRHPPMPPSPTPSRSSCRACGTPSAARSARIARPGRCMRPTPRTTVSRRAPSSRRAQAMSLRPSSRLAAEAGVPITMRGAGTSIAGNAIGRGLVIDTSRHLNAILDLDPDAATATVQPGVVLDDLNAAAAVHGLRVGPDPSTHSRCTVGGMIGNNACGSHSVRWGTTAQNVLGLELITADGVRRRVGRAGGLTGDPLMSGGLPGDATGLGPALDARIRVLAATHEALIRRDLPPWPRRVSGLRPRLAAPGARLRHREGPGRLRGDVCRRGGRDDLAGPAPGPPRAARARLRRRRRRRCGGPGAAARAPAHGREPDCRLPGRVAGSRAAAGRRGMAAGGGRRRHAGPGAGPRGAARGGDRRADRRPDGGADRGCRCAAAAVGGARGRGRPGGTTPRRLARLARPRGRGRAAGPACRVSHRAHDPAPRPRPARHHVRALRRGLRPPPGGVRTRPPGRGRSAGRIHDGGRGPRRRPRRHAVRRAR